jgi:hypothetical protein
VAVGVECWVGIAAGVDEGELEDFTAGSGGAPGVQAVTSPKRATSAMRLLR